MDEHALDIFNLIIQSNFSVLWIQETMQYANQDRDLRKRLKKFTSDTQGILPLNVGTLIMASYMTFVLPQQAIFNNINPKNIDISGFEVLKGEKDCNTVINGVRKALLKGNIFLEDNFILFRDEKNTFDKNLTFEAKILYADFGNFTNNFFHYFKDSYFCNIEPKE